MSRALCSRRTGVHIARQSLLPFLYQTTTIQRSDRQNVAAETGQVARRGFRSAPSTNRESLSFKDFPPNFFKEKAQSMEAKKPKSRSTITKAEREAFDSIMKLFSSSSPETDQAKATSANNSDVDFQNILDIFISSEAEQHRIPSRHEWGESRSPHFESNNAQQRLEADFAVTTAQFSRSDAAAELAKTYSDEGDDRSRSYLQPDRDTQMLIKQTASAVMQAISTSFDAALMSQNPAPDIAVWRVCEDSIFPLISLLKLDPIQLSGLNVQQPSEHEITSEDFEAEKHAEPQPPSQQSLPLDITQLPPYIATLISADCPILPLLTQLYPATLLLALRLYLNHHPSSLFALSLLPRIRQLGPTSYVLGANTHFYNALMTLRWDIYSDLRSIDALLSEMQRGGVEMDRSTFSLIKRIRTERRRDMGLANVENWKEQPQSARRPRSWWERREQVKWFHRVCIEWSDSIARKLTMRGEADMLVMREGPEDEGHDNHEAVAAFPARQTSASFDEETILNNGRSFGARM